MPMKILLEADANPPINKIRSHEARAFPLCLSSFKNGQNGPVFTLFSSLKKAEPGMQFSG